MAKAGAIEVSGLVEVIEAAKWAKDEWGRAVLREIRAAIAPMQADIRNRFDALRHAGPLVGATVAVSVLAKGAAIRMGGSKAPYAAGMEWGSKKTETRPFIRKVGTGRLAARKVGGGEGRVIVSHINYSSPNIFGPWTGNQFDLGQTGDRVTFAQVSGHAFFPGIAAGGQGVVDRLLKIEQDTLARFPDGNIKAANAASAAARLESLL